MSIFYINGEFVSANHATIPVNDLSVLRGYGAFDFFRTYGGKPFRLQQNVARLRRSADLIGLTYPWSDDDISTIVLQTLAHNALPEANIRIVITGGISSDNITPNGSPSLIVMVTPVRTLPEWWYSQGVKTITFDMERLIPNSKSINYIPAILALKEAHRQDAVEAFYVNRGGFVTEGTTTNLFAFFHDTLVTPDDSILPGITRGVVLDLCRAAGIPVEIRDIHRTELYQAHEVFMTASNKQVVPVIQIDEQLIGTGNIGSHTQQVMALFRAETERSAHSEHII